MPCRRLVLWFLAGCGLIVVEMTGFLSDHDWEPTALLQVGDVSPARPIILRELGPAAIAPTQGHDGKYFYLVARQPWFWRAEPDTLHGVQDPPYRYGRPLYPLLAGLGGTLPPRATFAGLVLVQILAGGLLAAATAALVRFNDLPVLVILLAIANPGVYFSAIFLTSDLLALALMLVGICCWKTGRLKPALPLFAAAALAKEYYAIAPLALAAQRAWQGKWRDAIVTGAMPLLPLAAWRLAIWVVLGAGEGGGNLGRPGAGIAAAFPEWNGPSFAFGVMALVLVAASVIAVGLPTPPLPRVQCLAWTALALVASDLVWVDPTNLLRAVAPLWWFALWALATRPAPPPIPA